MIAFDEKRPPQPPPAPDDDFDIVVDENKPINRDAAEEEKQREIARLFALARVFSKRMDEAADLILESLRLASSKNIGLDQRPEVTGYVEAQIKPLLEEAGQLRQEMNRLLLEKNVWARGAIAQENFMASQPLGELAKVNAEKIESELKFDIAPEKLTVKEALVETRVLLKDLSWAIEELLELYRILQKEKINLFQNKEEIENLVAGLQITSKALEGIKDSPLKKLKD